MAKQTFTIFAILALLVTGLGVVGAASLSITDETFPSSISHDAGSFVVSFNITNNGVDTNVSLNGSSITQGAATMELGSDFPLGQYESKIIDVKVNFDSYQSGKIEGVIRSDPSGSGDTKNFTFSVPILSSPSLEISLKSPLTRTENGTIEVKNTGNVNLQNIDLVNTTSADFNIQFNESDFSLNAGESILVLVSSTNADDLSFRDDNSLDVKATNGTLDSNLITLSVPNPFYSGENQGKLKVSIDKVNVEKGFGSDESYWYPFDEIKLKVRVENDGNWDIEKVKLQLCLLDDNRRTCVLDEDDMTIDDEDFNLDSGDDKNVFVTFNLDADNLRGGNTDYTLYVSASGKIDDRDSPYDNNKTGESVSSAIEIRTDEKFVVLNKILMTDSSNYLNDSEASCGDKVRITARVWNIGDQDLDNDEVFVEIYNKELGIQKVVSFNNGIDSMDWESLEAEITIPQDAKEKTYPIKFTVYRDENLADNRIYKNSEDDKAEFYEPLKVANCRALVLEPSISASLDSEAKVGKELIITASITNNGGDNDFIISATGFENWTKLISVEPQILSIKEGDTGTAVIKMVPTQDGLRTFKINVVVDGKSYDQAVSVNISKGKLQGIFAGVSKPVLYLIFGIGIVLILILLTLVIKILQKPKKAEF